jgi:hypothetical protein
MEESGDEGRREEQAVISAAAQTIMTTARLR